MDLKKRNHFTPKKEESFVRFFLSLFKLGKIQLWFSSTMQENMCDEDHLSKVSVPQDAFSHGRFSISFSNTFLCLLPNIEQKKCIPLNDNIVYCQTSKVIKDLSNIGNFSSTQESNSSVLSTGKFYVFFEKNVLQKKTMKLEALLCKKSSQNFVK